MGRFGSLRPALRLGDRIRIGKTQRSRTWCLQRIYFCKICASRCSTCYRDSCVRVYTLARTARCQEFAPWPSHPQCTTSPCCILALADSCSTDWAHTVVAGMTRWSPRAVPVKARTGSPACGRPWAAANQAQATWAAAAAAESTAAAAAAARPPSIARVLITFTEQILSRLVGAAMSPCRLLQLRLGLERRSSPA